MSDQGDQSEQTTHAAETLRWTFRPLGWGDALAVSRWRYPGPYAQENMSLLATTSVAFVHPILNALGLASFYVVADERRQRVGIFSYIKRRDAIEIGLGLRPDLVGQGRNLGLAFVEAGLAYGRTRYAPARFMLLVGAYNLRAQRVYERAGFTPVRTVTRAGEHGTSEFIEMVRDEK
ncbi:MAG: GNAT family N-acetyltransferase [Ktedonobacterales bacterium]